MLSKVHQGVAFEQRSLRLLQDNLSMSLRRVGGKSDGGVDLLGWWWLPLHLTGSSTAGYAGGRNRLRVLAQCKAEKKRASPKYIRELEGVAARLSTSQFPSVSLFISESSFTRATLLRAHSSAFPFFLLQIPSLARSGDAAQPESPDSCGHIGTALWNPPLTRLLGEGMQIRWEVPDKPGLGPGRPGIWYKTHDQWSRLQNWTPDATMNTSTQEDDLFEASIKGF